MLGNNIGIVVGKKIDDNIVEVIERRGMISTDVNIDDINNYCRGITIK